jgi:hypothetical protein
MMITAPKIDLVGTIARDGGFTFAPLGGLIPVGSVTGWAIAVPGTERVVGHAGITRETFAAVFADLMIEFEREIAAGAVVGGWYSEARGVYMIELTEIHDLPREEAVEIAVDRDQEAIFNLATGEYVATGGNGDGAHPEDCAAVYRPDFPFTCDLPAGHDGDHEDHVSDEPSTLAWQR